MSNHWPELWTSTGSQQGRLGWGHSDWRERWCTPWFYQHRPFPKARGTPYFYLPVTCSKYTPHAKTGSGPTLPQSLWLEELAEAILDFFLLSFSFSPASTTSLESLRQLGQYLRHCEKHVTNRENQYINQLMSQIKLSHWPVFIFRDGGQWGVQAVGVIGHVTLVAQQLLVWILLDATNLAVARAAGDIWIVLTVLALGAIGSFHFKK